MSTRGSTLLALFKLGSPSKFSVTLLCQQPSRQKFRLKTFTGRNRIFNISVMDCEKASRKILSCTHRRRLNSMSDLLSPKVNPKLQYIGKSQFHRCQHFWLPPFSANLQTWCFIGGQGVQKQNCVDTTLQVNFKHLSA